MNSIVLLKVNVWVFFFEVVVLYNYPVNKYVFTSCGRFILGNRVVFANH